MAHLRDSLSTEMARTRDQQNALGELISGKDHEIDELKTYTAKLDQKAEELERDDEEMKTQCMTLEVHNKSLMAQVESLQATLAGTTEIEALSNEIRQTVEKERAASEELVAEKERNLNLELEIKDLQHKINIMTASMQELRDVQGISDDIRELVGSAGESAAELLAEKERSLAMQVENATLRREVELLQEQSREQEGKLELVLGEISSLGHNVDGARSMAEALLVEKDRTSQLQVCVCGRR